MTQFTITKIERHSPEELIANMRKVSMLKAPQVFPYERAEINLKKMTFDEVLPAQRYVLGNGLHKAQCLEWQLERFGVDLFNLNGYVTIWTDQSDEPIDVLPPVVEAMIEADGSKVNIINDGMHRMYVARLEWKHPQVVFIENVPPEYPYYAYPIAGDNRWEQIAILEDDHIPAGLIKKWHRTKDNKQLYRNFNSSFINVGGPRGQG